MFLALRITSTETRMKNAAISAIAVLLVAGSAVQVTPASARHVGKAPAASSQSFRNAYGSAEGGAGWCSEEPGNPYNPQTDYMAWSAWRAHGAWDSRNDC
jgi:uncharacterized membrane protein